MIPRSTAGLYIALPYEVEAGLSRAVYDNASDCYKLTTNTYTVEPGNCQLRQEPWRIAKAHLCLDYLAKQR